MGYALGLVSISFRDKSPEELLVALKASGLTCIEWGSDVHAPPARAAEVAALTEKYGVTCCSYGTYFRLGITPMEELPAYIAAAKQLGTDILRLWCGDKNSEEYTEGEKQALLAACREAAAMAEAADVTLCMECHNNTFTNRKEAALELMEAVASPRFRMYWQPNQFRSFEENVAYARLLAPYTEHLHVFNWEGREKYPLTQATEVWKTYLSCFEGGRTLLLEFMPDGRLETLKAESETLTMIAEDVR